MAILTDKENSNKGNMTQPWWLSCSRLILPSSMNRQRTRSMQPVASNSWWIMDVHRLKESHEFWFFFYIFEPPPYPQIPLFAARKTTSCSMLRWPRISMARPRTKSIASVCPERGSNPKFANSNGEYDDDVYIKWLNGFKWGIWWLIKPWILSVTRLELRRKYDPCSGAFFLAPHSPRWMKLPRWHA